MSISCKTIFDLYYLFQLIEQPIPNSEFWQRNFCLFTFWVLLPGKSLRLMSQHIQKCQNNSLQKKIKTLCNTLDWGNWNSEFGKLVVRWAEPDINPEFSQTNNTNIDSLKKSLTLADQVWELVKPCGEQLTKIPYLKEL